MASKGSQSSRRGSSMDDSNKRSASSRGGNKPAQSAGSRGGSQSGTRSGSSGRKNESNTDR